MHPTRRRFGALSAAALSTMALPSVLAAPSGARAQAYPSKPVRLIVPFGAGGSVDLVGRQVGEALSRRLGQQVVVENRTGAAGNIGMDAVVRADPDGYTIGLAATNNLATNQHLMASMPFDPLTAVAPITLVCTLHNVLVTAASAPYADLASLAAWAKRPGNALTYASAGIGSQAHLGMELWRRLAGIEGEHVPYRGGADALRDVVAGRVAAMLAQEILVRGQIESGQLKALGVASAARRPSLPTVPTFAEQGHPDFEAVSWFGLVGPAALPAAIVMRLQQETAAALAEPDLRRTLAESGADPVGGPPEAFAALIRADAAKWGRVIEQAGIPKT